MGRGVNRVIIIGTLGRDPETRQTQSGKAVANISVATNEQWKDKQTGQNQERTEWHRVAMFDRLAEIAGQYLTTGSKVYIEGQLRTRKWQGQDGQDRFTTEIVAKEMQFLGGGNQGQQSGQGQTESSQDQSQPVSGGGPDFDDDIPFAQHERGFVV